MSLIEVCVPKFPACHEPCGACFNADDTLDVFVVEILVRPGDPVEAEQVVAVVETNKTTLEVPAPRAGIVKDIKVKAADSLTEGSVLLTLAPGGT